MSMAIVVTLLDRDNFLGRILTGLVLSGTVKVNQQIHALNPDGDLEAGRASKIMSFRGLFPVDQAQAGDIISMAGDHPPQPVPPTRSRSPA